MIDISNHGKGYNKAIAINALMGSNPKSYAIVPNNGRVKILYYHQTNTQT